MDDPLTDTDGTEYLLTATYAKNKAGIGALPSSFGSFVTTELDFQLVIDSSDSQFVGDIDITLKYTLQDYLDSVFILT